MQVSPLRFPADHPRACPQHTHTHAPACLRARMLAHVRCAGVQPASAGLQPPGRVHWVACCTHTLHLCTHICSFVQAGTMVATMLGCTPCTGRSLRFSQTVGAVLAGIGPLTCVEGTALHSLAQSRLYTSLDPSGNSSNLEAPIWPSHAAVTGFASIWVKSGRNPVKILHFFKSGCGILPCSRHSFSRRFQK